MGNAAAVPVEESQVMEGIHASVAGLDALFLKDAELDRAGSDVVGSGATDVDVLQRKSELRLQRLEAWSRLEAQIAAGKARDAAEFAEFQEAMTPPEATDSERAFVEMSTTAEVASVLTVSSGAAGALVGESRKIRAMPLVWEALAAGSVSWRHAVIVADETDCLAPGRAAALVAHFFDPDAPNPARGNLPGELVPHLFRRKVRTWRERTYPDSLQERHAACVADRRMEYRPDADGMAWITLHLPGDTACAIWNKTTALARGLQHPGEARTLTQLRPDVAARLLLGEPGQDLSQPAAPRADVLVMVPIFTMTGHTDEPAELDGYGPIPAAMARTLVVNGAHSFYRVLVDPRDGTPLEIGRTGYRLTEAMKRWIRMRDGHCTFPGCSNPTPDNETDHLTAWQHDGTTGVSNLAQLCPKHHRLKHNSRWTPTKATVTEPPGWTSPTGRHYPAHQPEPQPPHWPPGILEGESHWPPGLLNGQAVLPPGLLNGHAVLPPGLLNGQAVLPPGLLNGQAVLPPGLLSGQAVLPSGGMPGGSALPSGRPGGITGTPCDEPGDDEELSPLEAVLVEILAA